MARGRFDEALGILEHIAEVNGKKVPDSFKITLKVF